MKRLFLVPTLVCAALLLSACPDTKLPSPSPKVPEPKAETATLDVSPGMSVPGQHRASTLVASRS